MYRGVLFLIALIFLTVKVESKVNGGWAAWSEWSGWASGLCSGNQRVKTRPCTNPIPSTDGDYCTGDNAINEQGPVDGGWGEWSQWSTCAKPCGGSTVNRTRACDNPAKARGGKDCSGISIEHKLECLDKCPDGRVDGGYGRWGQWSPCPAKCTSQGGARVRRYRQCNQPTPMNGGSACKGSNVDEVTACANECPINGGFGQWSSWSGCSKTCGTGVTTRGRLCNNPEPKGVGAKNCTGLFTETNPCRLAICQGAVNGSWTAWTAYSACSSTFCLKGEKVRTRTCTNPSPANGGDDCLGSARDVRVCPYTQCTQYIPTPIPSVPVDAGSFMARECGAKTKYAALGQHASKVPQEVYNHLQFKQNNFKGGYFSMQSEEKGTIIKYCFDPIPTISIKDVADKLITSYRGTKAILGYTKPDETQPILGFAIRVRNESGYAVKGYEIGLQKFNEFTPGQRITLHDTLMTYYTEGQYRSFLAKGKLHKFSPNVFDAIVFRNSSYHSSTSPLPPGGLTSMTGKSASLSFQGILSGLGFKNMPGFMVTALKAIKLWDITFDKTTVGYNFFEGWQSSLSPFRVTATKFIDGIPIHFEMVAAFSIARWLFAIGVVFDGESFGACIGKITGTKNEDGGFFDSIGIQVELGIIVNPTIDFRVIKGSSAFTKQPNAELGKRLIKEGFQAVAQVSLPADCGGSSFCKVTKNILGPKVQFRIAAHFKAKGYVKVSAGFYKIRLGGDFWLWKVELFFEKNVTKKETTLGFAFEMKIPVNQGEIVVDGIQVKNELRLGGQVKHKLGSPDTDVQLFMRGMWRNAFGSNWLAIGNINIAFKIALGKLPHSPQFGGQLEFGKNCLYDADFEDSGHCFMIRAYFGSGKDSYFFGEISALTIGKLIRMFGGKAGAVPKPVAETGFPKGALIAKCLTKDIDLTAAGGPYIYKGMRIRGTLNLFGYNIRVDIKYGDDEIYFEAEIDPINLGGVLMFTRNKTHSNLGPKVLFHYRKKMAGYIPIPYFKFFFEGYGKFFGIEAYAFINITMQGFEIYIYGNAWGLIYAELYISASYDIFDITNANFYVRVIVDLRGLTEAIAKARDAVDKAMKAAQATLRSKVDEVKAAKRKCKEKMQLKCSNCYSLKCKQAEDNCKGFMDKAGKWIGGAINAAGKWIKKTARKIRDGLAKVGKAIKKFFSGWRRRRSLSSNRNENFDIHVRNRRFISKLICEGLVGGGCRGVEHMCAGTCKAVNFIGKGLCNILDVAVGALKLAEAVVGWVNAAIQFVLQMFLIHGLRFELGLGKKFGGGFMVAAEIDMTLFAQRFQFGFEFDMNNKFRSITSAKDSGMYKYKKGLKQPRTSVMYNSYDPPNPFTDFDLTGSFGIESTQSGDGVRTGSCLSALNKDEGSKLFLTGCNNTDTKQQWTYSLKGGLINAYSQKCLFLSHVNGAYVIQKNCDNKADRYGQRYDCDVVTRSLKRKRSNKCATAAKISPKGPGSLIHLGSLKCIQVNPSNKLMLRTGCQRANTEFALRDNGHLVNTNSGYCLRPAGGRAVIGAELEMATSGCHAFTFTSKGSLQHNTSRLCVQTSKMEMKPKDYTSLILGSRCNYINASSTAAFPDPQMVFSFIPTDPYVKMADCGYFDDFKMEQRFEVMNEELGTVCSKFAHDIALKKTSVQSSTSHNGFPSRAVDGDFTYTWAGKSCTHTKDEQDPWWRVDLGKEYIVTDITIVNRAEYGDRFKNIQVHVGNLETNHKRNPVCHDIVKQAFDGEAVRLQCNPPIPGQYVAVQMYGKGILSMCEVIVNSRLGSIDDWCQIENGGCDQLCINKCDKKTTCACLPGYTLAYDKKTCIDVDECLANNGGCRRDTKADCENYPGGYYCSCAPGYILKDDSLTECMDHNECGQGNGGCEQMCNNTIGSYLCACRAGYEREANLYGCKDIDECAVNNGGCDHTCENYHGGYTCKCRAGYRLAEDRHQCEDIYCHPMESPTRGMITPSICTERYANIPISTACKFNCSKGFELTATSSQVDLTCRIDGTWSAATPSCHPVKCPFLSNVANGGLVPSACHTNQREFGQRCVVYCKAGYVKRGPSVKYCGSNKQWSTDVAFECVKEVVTPYLNCPADIQLILPSDKSSFPLRYRFPEPQTNMRVTKVSHSRSHYFQVGLTVVKFEAATDDGVKKMCSVLVEVMDKTPPKIVRNCPSDIVQTTSVGVVSIPWTPPVFTDNVGIATIEQPHRSPNSNWRVGESATLQYRAVDTSGNSAKCTFKVTIKSDKCPNLTGDSHTSIYAFTPGISYYVSCTQGSVRALSGPFGTSGQMVSCKGDQYVIYLGLRTINLGTRAPDCVLYQSSDSSSPCPKGYQKHSYRNVWTGQTVYYCSQCPPGTFHNATASTCQPCAVGTYQDEAGSGNSECEICPKMSITEKTGSRSVSECLAECQPGSYSPSGYDQTASPCVKCPKGTYSSLDGAKECSVCPTGLSTSSTGSTGVANCTRPPMISEVVPSAQVVAEAGKDLTLECYFKASPEPTTTWTRSNGALPSGSQATEILDMQMEKIGMMLEIKNVAPSNAGVYTCAVQNGVGQHSKTISVTVQ